MKKEDSRRWLMVLVLLLGTFHITAATETSEEDLPEPEGWRQGPPRQQHGPRPGVGGGVGGFGGGAQQQESSSYDLTDAYNTLAANRVGGLFTSTGSAGPGTNTNSKTSAGYGAAGASSSASNYYGSYGSEIGYGGYGSESGYGLSCSSGYVNASAVALLAFLFLLNIIQDVVQQVTGGRRKRDIVADEENDVFAFIHNGGLSALKEGLPEVVLPLMVDLMEASEAHACVQRPLCEANRELSTRYGVVGRVVASLLSNVVGKAFTADDVPKFHQALHAASEGRAGSNCAIRFPGCPSHSRSHGIDGNQSGEQPLHDAPDAHLIGGDAALRVNDLPSNDID